MKITLIKKLFFVAVISSLGAIAQAENLPSDQQVISSKTMSKPTYVEEYQAITEVLNKYIEGCKQAKSSIIVGADAELSQLPR